MAIVTTDDRHYKAIANTIREKAGINDALKPDEMSGYIKDACEVCWNEGYNEGKAEGYQEGHVDGKVEGREEGYAVGKEDGIEEGKQDEQAVTDALLSDTNIGDYHNDRVTSLPSYALAYRRSMTSAYLPNVTRIAAQAFGNCTGLVKAELPNLTSVASTENFGSCSALEHVDLGHINSLPASTFNNASSLKSVVLRRDTGCSLPNTNSFNGTPFANGGSGGTIYVPAALVEAYAGNTNWSALTANFVALEGSEYE